MQRKKEERRKKDFGHGLSVRIFCSVLLILLAVFIKQNSPFLLEKGRHVLTEWTITWHEKEA